MNRIAEITEKAAHGFGPYGSLLEYIDQHLEEPDMPLDRTLGSEVNVLLSIQALKVIFPWAHFKAFDRRPGHIPSRHGDFNKAPFWRRTFWETGTVTMADPEDHTRLNCYEEDWLEKEPAAKRVEVQGK